MSRIRTVKPEWAEDERLCMCSDGARVLSVSLLLWADDHGNGRLGPELTIAARAFPALSDFLEHYRSALAELCGWYFDRYEHEGQTYYHIKNWRKHQKIDHPGKPTCPRPEDCASNSRESREDCARPSRDLRETLAPDLDLDLDQDLDQDHDQDQDRAREDARVFSSGTCSKDPAPALMDDRRPMGEERDLLLAICAEYGTTWRCTPPDLPTGDHQRRFLAALRDPSGGFLVLKQAVRGHHARASREGSKTGKEIRHVVPPATDHGKTRAHVPDMTRVLEYASLGGAPAAKKWTGR